MKRSAFLVSTVATGIAASSMLSPAHAEANSYTGIWSCTATGEGSSGNATGHFTLSLAQSGGVIAGVYYNGTASLVGHLSGNEMAGTWDESGSKGALHFVFASDGRSFTGSWGVGGHTQGQWNGTKAS